MSGPPPPGHIFHNIPFISCISDSCGRDERSFVSLQRCAALPACSEQKQLAQCRPQGRCSMCTAFLAAFFGDVEVGNRVPSGCCTHLMTDIPLQTFRLLGPEAGTPFFRSNPPYKGSLFRSQCHGSRSPPPSFQRQEDSCPLQSFVCQRRHVRRSNARCLYTSSGGTGRCPLPPVSATPVLAPPEPGCLAPQRPARTS